MKLRCLFFLLPVMLVSCLASCGQNVAPGRKIFIVRHAEKDTGQNPVLSAAGRQRAGDLYRRLKAEDIDVIMVSQYRRTAMTGDSLRIYANTDTAYYKADTSGYDVMQRIGKLPADVKNILIIGHSNTLPGIIRRAGVKDFLLAEIPDHEYDNLFIIISTPEGLTLKCEKFGAASVHAKPDAPAMKLEQNAF